MPEHKAVTTPETKLGGEKAPAKEAMVPPRIVDNAPMYGPSIMPIVGAIIAAAVMVLLGKPIIGDMGMKPKTVYKAVKHTIKAAFFAESFLSIAIYETSLVCGKVIILIINDYKETACPTQ
jgi:hypothetical protein